MGKGLINSLIFMTEILRDFVFHLALNKLLIALSWLGFFFECSHFINLYIKAAAIYCESLAGNPRSLPTTQRYYVVLHGPNEVKIGRKLTGIY